MFRYIRHDEHSGWSGFEEYFAYLASVEDRLGADLYAFAADEDRYNLWSHKSLHDAWLRTLTLAPVSDQEQTTGACLDLEFIGPYHDRLLRLRYEDVEKYSLQQPAKAWAKVQDLLMHELRFDEADGLIEHAFAFDADRTLFVACRAMSVEEIMLETDEAGENG